MNNEIVLKDWQTHCGFASPQSNINIYYSPLAITKTIMLVNTHPEEIGWNMVVKPYKDGYKVEDIVVYPQKVSPAYVSVDLPRYGLWKANLDDEVEANLFGNGHSHVNMSTFASSVDERQQHDEILTKKNGFYLFQIWNKRNEISSFFYDIDNKIFYRPENVNIIVEEANEFIINSFEIVQGRHNRINAYEAGEDF